jgi:hypothetical protein
MPARLDSGAAPYPRRSTKAAWVTTALLIAWPAFYGVARRTFPRSGQSSAAHPKLKIGDTRLRRNTP